MTYLTALAKQYENWRMQALTYATVFLVVTGLAIAIEVDAGFVSRAGLWLACVLTVGLMFGLPALHSVASRLMTGSTHFKVRASADKDQVNNEAEGKDEGFDLSSIPLDKLLRMSEFIIEAHRVNEVTKSYLEQMARVRIDPDVRSVLYSILYALERLAPPFLPASPDRRFLEYVEGELRVCRGFLLVFQELAAEHGIELPAEKPRMPREYSESE